MQIKTPTLVWLARLSLAIIFIWFGLIKLLHLSPAEALVKELYAVTLGQFGLFSLDGFVLFLGLIECIIGVGWLIPRMTKFVFRMFSIQMFTTFGPMVFLPAVTWQYFGVPTLVGQYIIKNICLIVVALYIVQQHHARK